MTIKTPVIRNSSEERRVNLESANFTGCSKTPSSHNDYMGLLTILKNLDKDFARDMITKLLKNVMKGDQVKSVKKPRRRQASRLSKRIRDRKRLLIETRDMPNSHNPKETIQKKTALSPLDNLMLMEIETENTTVEEDLTTIIQKNHPIETPKDRQKILIITSNRQSRRLEEKRG